MDFLINKDQVLIYFYYLILINMMWVIIGGLVGAWLAQNYNLPNLEEQRINLLNYFKNLETEKKKK